MAGFNIVETVNQGGKFLIYGQEGSGKTNLALNMPKPAFIAAEDRVKKAGLMKLVPSGWDDIVQTMQMVAEGQFKDQVKTLVIDTATAVEPMMHKHFMSKHNITELADFGGRKVGGSYAWRDAVLQYWDQFTQMLDYIYQTQNINIVVLAHNKLADVKNRNTDSFHKEDLDFLNPKVSEKLRRWADVTGFIHRDFVVVNTTGNDMMKNNIAKGSGDLKIGLRHKPDYHAKCDDFGGLIDTIDIDTIPYSKDANEFLQIFAPVLAK